MFKWNETIIVYVYSHSAFKNQIPRWGMKVFHINWTSWENHYNSSNMIFNASDRRNNSDQNPGDYSGFLDWINLITIGIGLPLTLVLITAVFLQVSPVELKEIVTWHIAFSFIYCFTLSICGGGIIPHVTNIPVGLFPVFCPAAEKGSGISSLHHQPFHFWSRSALQQNSYEFIYRWCPPWFLLYMGNISQCGIHDVHLSGKVIMFLCILHFYLTPLACLFFKH